MSHNDSIPPEKIKIINSQSITVEQNKIEGAMLFIQGPVASDEFFILQCTNLPVNTTIVGFKCDTKIPDFPIYLPPTKVTRPSFSMSIQTQVPADFTGTINFYAQFDQTPPAGAEITLAVGIPEKE